MCYQDIHTRILKVLTSTTLIVIIASALLLYPVSTTMAAGTLVLSEAEGYPGDRIEVNGSGFVVDLVLKAYFSSDLAKVGDEIDTKVTTYKWIGDAGLNNQAAFTLPITFSIPSRLDDGKTVKNVSCGDYFVYVVYSGSKRIEATTQFFVLGPVVLSPSTGRIGEWTRINGTGLKPNNAVYAYFSSNRASIGASIGSAVSTYQNVGLVATDTQGNLAGGLAFQIPDRLTDGNNKEDVHGGNYYVYLAYFSSRTRIETVTRFVVLNGEIRLDPAEGSVGTETNITVKGLRPNQSVTITYDEDVVSVGNGDQITDTSGNLNCTILIPGSTTGSHKVVVADVTGNRPEAWFTIKPILSAPDSAAVSETIDVSGSGFSEVMEVVFTLDGQPVSSTPPIVNTNRRGSFAASLRLPPPAGTFILQATDKLHNKAESRLVVLAPSKGSATIVFSPETNQASIGEQTTIVGRNFKPNSSVNVTFGYRQTIILPGLTTSAGGGFETVFEIPPSRVGENTVTATDGTNTARAIFIVESVAPPPPIPIGSESTSTMSTTSRFDWTDVADSSGVTFTLQVAADVAFTTVALEKSQLARSEYTLTSQEQLGLKNRQTAYYWRVKAIDGAQNESDWTVPVSFYVRSTASAIPGWSVIVFGILGLLLVIILGLWLNRLSRGRQS